MFDKAKRWEEEKNGTVVWLDERWVKWAGDRRFFPSVSLQQWADVGPTGLHQHGSPKAGTVANTPTTTIYSTFTYTYMHLFTKALNISILLYCITRPCSWANALWDIFQSSIMNNFNHTRLCKGAKIILLSMKNPFMLIKSFTGLDGCEYEFGIWWNYKAHNDIFALIKKQKRFSYAIHDIL